MCAWMKYKSLQYALEDKHVDIKLRLKLFKIAVSPAALYSLETCPLTQHQLEHLDIIQRKMLRKIVGFVYDTDDTWEEFGHRMNICLDSALKHVPIENWSTAIWNRKQKLLRRTTSLTAPPMTKIAFEWMPTDCAFLNRTVAKRQRGHPRCRWYDQL